MNILSNILSQIQTVWIDFHFLLVMKRIELKSNTYSTLGKNIFSFQIFFFRWNAMILSFYISCQHIESIRCLFMSHHLVFELIYVFFLKKPLRTKHVWHGNWFWSIFTSYRFSRWKEHFSNRILKSDIRM